MILFVYVNDLAMIGSDKFIIITCVSTLCFLVACLNLGSLNFVLDMEVV